ncbi:hypothetical protein K432DRAFT_310707 [Lepidopterella palustris CBS 459.81]|uniref:Fumarylacetoacetase-like C-terminal domain-containing protein n=1 Tax=Lepidopterella palustris CBS 459.81 TaxID=1314670 RepID=A0A8E2J9N6_9PEZI|nr:hypothetical protein K432DRAFT_310707 [Lepidopterella palustris CBS 459.81]
MTKSSWTHLVRFDLDGSPSFGQLCEPAEDGKLEELIKVNVATGDPVLGTIKQTGKIITVAREALLMPIATCPIVSIIGINYDAHVKESGQSEPTIPMIFYKPRRSLAAPFPLIRVHQLGQEHLDYEGELVFQTGPEPVKNVSEADARNHIIGYTSGCDFTARDGKVLKLMNFCFGKSFDGFSPVGPVLVHPSVVGDPLELSLETRLNGEVVQRGNTADMISSCAKLLSVMSSGTTVEPGTVVFTGSPGGSAHFVGGTGVYITDGDRVEVEITKIGKISAQFKFD